MDVSVGATAASNPFMVNGTDTEALGATLTFNPSVFHEDEDTSLTLDGAIVFEQYFDSYGGDVSLDLSATSQHRVNERTTVVAGVSVRSSESAARRYFGGGNLGELEPGEFPESPLIDPTLGNLAGRTTRFDVNTSVEHVLNPTSSLSGSAGFGLTRAEGGAGEDYRNVSLGTTYTRRLTARTSLLTTIDAGYADYIGQQAGDGLFVSGLAGIQRQFSASVNLSAQLGASVVSSETLGGGRDTTLGWAGNFDLCDSDERETLCINGSRSAQPTSLRGLTTVSSIAVSYERSFGPEGSISATASYARTSQSQNSFLLPINSESELLNVSATYRRTLGQRVSAFVTPSFTSIADEFSSRRENYQVMLGLSYYFGRLR